MGTPLSAVVTCRVAYGRHPFMRKLTSLLPVLVALPGLAQYEFDHAIIDELAWREGHHWHGTLRSDAPPTRGYDLKYMHAEWAVDPAVRAIEGTVTLWFTATSELDVVVLDLSDTLVVDDVRWHGQAISWDLALGDVFTVDVPGVLSAGVLDSISVTYHGVPRTSGFGSFGTGTQPNGSPALWTLSEPYGAKDWWPAKQDLNDKLDSVDLIVTTPQPYRVASNGRLIAETMENGSTTFHWRHRYPIAYYLISLAVADYIVLNTEIIAGTDTIPMVTYSYYDNPTMAGLNAGDVAVQLPLFTQLFGRYPFAEEKYGHAQFGWGGGMEHQTMTSMGGWNYGLAAHELAHQWFGDKVTCGSWEDIWLNEGFATYLQGLTAEYLVPQYWREFLESNKAIITSDPTGSVRCTDTTSIARIFSSRLSYRKGAAVLHMLRWVCGDSAFYNGVRNYLNDPGLAYGSARTSDLVDHLEATSGIDLSGFMADWFVGEGYPTYTLQWTQEQGGGTQAMLFQSPSHPSVDFFEMPVPVRFWNDVQDTTVVLDHTVSGQSFTFSLPFLADSAEVDPELWILSGQNIATSVPDLDADRISLVLWPNPAGDQVTLRVPGLRGPAEVQVVDAAGRTVLTTPTNGGMDRTIDVRSLVAGHYTVILRSGTTYFRSALLRL